MLHFYKKESQKYEIKYELVLVESWYSGRGEQWLTCPNLRKPMTIKSNKRFTMKFRGGGREIPPKLFDNSQLIIPKQNGAK